MSERELDRLNYYNGKRLLASDLKLEQEYHIRVRRWLNKSLYAAGIARGLEVREVPGSPAVIVSPGLALDSEGREIILLDEVRIDVRGLASRSPCGGKPGDGSYLTIQYDEEVIADQSDGCCAPSAGTSRNGNSVAWGGPARVRAEPVLQWTDVLPAEGSGEIVLAQVSLKTGCRSVQSVDAGVRRYIGAASANKVRQYALEGFRDLSSQLAVGENPQRIFFHIRGRQATSVTLYLRAEKMPSLYYTEMGGHTHILSSPGAADGAHEHSLGTPRTTDAGNHRHRIASDFAPDNDLVSAAASAIASISQEDPLQNVLVVAPRIRITFTDPLNSNNTLTTDVPPTIRDTSIFSESADPTTHFHTLSANQKTANDGAHTHAAGSAAPAGVDVSTNSDYSARRGPPLTYLADLAIWIDGVDQSNSIKQQLQAAIPTERTQWQQIGDGTNGHPLVANGTRAIKLDFLPGVFFGEGEHSIEFRVAPKTVNGAVVPNGGRINYNLYVE